MSYRAENSSRFYRFYIKPLFELSKLIGWYRVIAPRIRGIARFLTYRKFKTFLKVNTDYDWFSGMSVI